MIVPCPVHQLIPAAMDAGLGSAVCIVLALTLLYIWCILKGRNTECDAKPFPPGPPGLPIIGNLHQLNLKKLHVSLLEFANKYGPVYSIQMGPSKIVVITGYEAVKDALVNHAEEFGERGKIRILQDMDKDLGITHSQGENGKVMRRFALTALRDLGMGRRSIEERIIEECEHLIKNFASFKGKPFNNMLIIYAGVANIIVSILLGHRMDYDDPQFKRLLNLIYEIFRLAGSKMVRLYNIFPIFGFLPGGHKTFIKHGEEFLEFVNKTFVKYQKNLDENDRRSFIDSYLLRQKDEAGKPRSYFHNENLTIVVKNLFSAGTETTATTLRWGLLLMMKYPDIQEKVQDEISRVIGSAQPMYSHRLQMPYTNAVIHEIQRFADIVPLNGAHETTKDVMFRGYFIPKETYIIPLLSSVLRDKTQFERSEQFYPNHFLDSEGNFINKDAFMPFSAGRRACVGETLARMELFIFFTSLLQQFTFHLPPDVSDLDLTPGTGFTNVPQQYNMCATLRI
ncbi:cytochrome P450 2K6-like [Hyperolius riggenbachi]|uniref:cytochrome P450 2K6-like n=1 Tax=Hyperolius riggenbachi TaxID=752182 RepID=UPI0035A31BC4